jgi:fatty acid amide hydrolase
VTPESPTPVSGLELTSLTASELADGVRRGELSAREIVDAHIGRIEEVDGRLNAVIARRFHEVRADADTLDAARAAGEDPGPLAGVPMTVKEQWDVAGLPTAYGLPSRANHRAERDAPLIERMRRAGAMLLGKTNTPQLLMYQESDNPLHGRTNNPWDLGRTPGGGTGGEGAIIAAGGSALGLAADIGGSIRLPSHFCAVPALKATSLRLTTLGSPREFFFPGFYDIVMDAGPFGRSVADLALAMEVLAAPGQERIDPRVPPVAWPDHRAVDISRLRVAYFDDDGVYRPSPAIRRAVHEAADALRAAGAEVEPFRPPNAEASIALYLSFVSADALEWIKAHARENPIDRRTRTMTRLARLPEPVKPLLAGTLRSAGQRRLAASLSRSRRLSVREYWDLVIERDDFRTGFMEAFDAGRFDAIVCPPCPLPALTHGSTYYLFAAVNTYSLLFNMTGFPAGVVPATRVRPGEESDRPESRDRVDRTARDVERGSAGLPVGVQVAARQWREDVVLALMAFLEEQFRSTPDYPARPPL